MNNNTKQERIEITIPSHIIKMVGTMAKEDKINGKTIEKYLSSLEEEKFKKQFAEYSKKGIDRNKINEHFENTLKEIKKKFGEE